MEDLTKSSKKRRSICLIASSRNPDPPVVCYRDQTDAAAKNEPTDFENPIAPCEEIFAHFWVPVINLLKINVVSQTKNRCVIRPPREGNRNFQAPCPHIATSLRDRRL